MASVREKRQAAIRELVRSEHIASQHDLADALATRGFSVAQATISRDMTALSLVKDGNGRYVLPEDMRLQTMARTAVLETRRAANLIVVITKPGSASSVAAAIDDARLDGVLGSIAGDDTVLVIAADEQAGAGFEKRIGALQAPARGKRG